MIGRLPSPATISAATVPGPLGHLAARSPANWRGARRASGPILGAGASATVRRVDLDLLTELCETPGAPGREDRIREVARRELSANADEVTVDPLGSLVARRAGRGGPRLMLSAHMDEIGFMVSHVEEAGYLRLLPLGGFDPKTLTAQRVVVHGREDLLGVLGTKAVHLMSDEEKRTPPKLDDFLAFATSFGGHAVLDLELKVYPYRAAVLGHTSARLEAAVNEDEVGMKPCHVPRAPRWVTRSR